MTSKSFEFQCEIGRGSQATVVLAKDTESKKSRAIKVWNHCTSDQERFETAFREFLALSFVESSRSLLWNPETPMDLALEMDLWDGPLASVLNKQDCPMSEDLVRTLFLPIVSQLQDMSLSRVAHQDLGPSNILVHIKDRQLTLCDFGIAGFVPNANSCVQTLWYRPPEIALQDFHDEKADVFSFGLVLLHALTGQSYIRTDSEDIWLEQVENIHQDSFVNADKDSCWHLLEMCLQRMPTDRPTMAQVIQHPFWKKPKRALYLFEEDAFWQTAERTFREKRNLQWSHGLSSEIKDHISNYSTKVEFLPAGPRGLWNCPPKALSPKILSKLQGIQKRLQWSHNDLLMACGWLTFFDEPVNYFQILSAFWLVYIFNCEKRASLHRFCMFCDLIMDWDTISISSDDSMTAQDQLVHMYPELMHLMKQTRGNLPNLTLFDSDCLQLSVSSPSHSNIK